MNVLDFKKDVGLWHGILTVSVTPLPARWALLVPLDVLVSDSELGSVSLAAWVHPCLPHDTGSCLKLLGNVTCRSIVNPWALRPLAQVTAPHAEATVTEGSLGQRTELCTFLPLQHVASAVVLPVLWSLSTCLTWLWHSGSLSFYESVFISTKGTCCPLVLWGEALLPPDENACLGGSAWLIVAGATW